MKFHLNQLVNKEHTEELLFQSHRTDFARYSTPTDLDALRDHRLLYQKVVDELQQDVRGEEMACLFKNYVEGNSAKIVEISSSYINPSKVESTQFSVSLLKPSTWSNPQWDYVCKSPTISNVKSDLGGIVEKINNFNLSSESLWQNIRKSLVFCDETNLLRKDVVKYHIEGIKTLNVVDMPRFNEAVHQVYTFFMKILDAFDVAVLLEYCKTNEKFMFLLLYPYLFKPLRKLLWSQMLPIFYLKAKNFTVFMKTVALKIGGIISHKTALVRGLSTIKVNKRFAVTGLSGLIVLYSHAFISNNVQAIELYGGLEGNVGNFIKLFRVETSKIIYEVTKTMSTFTNAAVAGFLEPKQEVIKEFVKHFYRK